MLLHIDRKIVTDVGLKSSTCTAWTCGRTAVETIWNVMAHAQKPHFVFRPNGRVHLNRLGASVHSTTGSWGVRISGSNAGYTMFRGSVKGTGYPLHSLVSPSLPLPCVTICHHISIELYRRARRVDDGQNPLLTELNPSVNPSSLNFSAEHLNFMHVFRKTWIFRELSEIHLWNKKQFVRKESDIAQDA
jgi:hypothetical protein